jgi:hypothetical protein
MGVTKAPLYNGSFDPLTLHKCCRCTPEFASATNYPVEQSILILALFCLDDGVRFTDHGVEDQTGILSSRKWLIG